MIQVDYHDRVELDLDRRDRIAHAISEAAAIAVAFTYMLGVLWLVGGGR